MILEAKKARFIIETANIEETTQKETDEIIERLNKYNDDELEITDKESVVVKLWSKSLLLIL